VVRELLLGRGKVLLESKYDLDLARGDGAVICSDFLAQAARAHHWLSIELSLVDGSLRKRPPR
jgi:hypothetical protein